jgi:predicted DNA-binding protein
MKRTQIYLSDETHAALRRAATEQGKTLATLARETLEAQFAAPRALREQAVVYAPARVRRAKKTRAAKKPRAKKLTQAELEANPLLQIVGLYASNKPDAGINHDKYLYREDKD